MSIELKIKSKHLALEPAIIRKEEDKVKKQIKHYKMYHQISADGTFASYKEHPELTDLWLRYGNLVSHRKWEVRNEARATYLARAFIKGVPYNVVEANIRELPAQSVINLYSRPILWPLWPTSLKRLCHRKPGKTVSACCLCCREAQRRFAHRPHDRRASQWRHSHCKLRAGRRSGARH